MARCKNPVERTGEIGPTMTVMRDLMNEVHRLLFTIDGMHFDNPEDVTIDEMLGVIEVGEDRDYDEREGTILDPYHHFWNHYRKDIMSGVDAEKEVQFAIHQLRNNGTFKMVSPEDADEDGGVFVDIAPLDGRTDGISIEITEEGSNAVLSVDTGDGTYSTVLTRE